MRKPDFFIVGAPKCGTTSMNFYLKEHPEVFVSDRKEPHFFGEDLVAPTSIRDEGKYLSLFSGVEDERRVGEASVWYLFSTRAAEEIKAFNPQASIIIMLRDPVEMMHSLHSHWLYSGNEDIKEFEAALDAEEDRKQGARISGATRFVEGLFYRETAKYTRQVRRYLDVFGRDNAFVIIYDDFERDTTGVYEDTLRFLGVSPGFRPEFRIVNQNKRVRSGAFHKLSTAPPGGIRRLARTMVPTSVRHNLSKSLRQYNTKHEPRRDMDSELSGRLRAEFAPEVERLSELLGRDLTHWSRAEAATTVKRDPS